VSAASPSLIEVLRRIPTRWRRLLTVLGTVAGVMIGGAVPAWATSETPPALSWMVLKDSKGINVWSYEMSLNTGGVTSPGKFVWSFLVALVWQGYRAIVVFAIWLINWVLGFSWLDWVSTPVIALSKSITSLVHTFGLAPTFLTIMAATAAVHIFRGRWTLGAFDLVVGCAIAALAVGGLSNPVGLVTGQSGYIMQSRDLGLELSSGLAHNGDTASNADQMRQQTSAMLVDTFIRMPDEMINFGRSLQGDPCEAKFDEVMRSGPHGGDDTVRNAMKDCNASMGDYADNPNSGMAISTIILSPSAIFVLLFALLLCVAVMLAVVTVLYESLKLIVVMVWAILPGESRGSLWQTFANLVMALATMTFAVVFLTAYLLLLQSVFSSSNSGSNGVMATFIFIDLLIFMGIIMFWRGRTALKRSAARLAAMMAKRPAGGSSSRLPAPQRSGLPGQAAALQAGRMLSQRAQGSGSGGSGGAGAEPGKTGAEPGQSGWVPAGTKGETRSVPRAGASGGGAADAAGAAVGAAGAGSRRRRGGKAGAAAGMAAAEAAAGAGAGGTAKDLGVQLAKSQGKKAVRGTLLKAAANAAAGVATGGASTAVTAASAARTANNVRRAAVAARLASSAAVGGAGKQDSVQRGSGAEALPGRAGAGSGGRSQPTAPAAEALPGRAGAGSGGRSLPTAPAAEALPGGRSDSPGSGGRSLPTAPARGGFDEVTTDGQTVLVPTTHGSSAARGQGGGPSNASEDKNKGKGTSKDKGTSKGSGLVSASSPSSPPRMPFAQSPPSPVNARALTGGADTTGQSRVGSVDRTGTQAPGPASAPAPRPVTPARAPAQATRPDNAASQLLRARLAARRQTQAPPSRLSR